MPIKKPAFFFDRFTDDFIHRIAADFQKPAGDHASLSQNRNLDGVRTKINNKGSRGM